MWLKVDDGFYDHPKVEEATLSALGLWVRCGSWSSRHKRDGLVPLRQVRKFGRLRDAEALVDVGLWVPVPGGFAMHDFLDYNPSKAELDARDAERDRARRAGGRSRATATERDDQGRFW